MKLHAPHLLTTIASLGPLATTQLSAALLTAEGFGYTGTTNINGQNGGTG